MKMIIKEMFHIQKYLLEKKLFTKYSIYFSYGFWGYTITPVGNSKPGYPYNLLDADGR